MNSSHYCTTHAPITPETSPTLVEQKLSEASSDTLPPGPVDPGPAVEPKKL